jgi:hypothetical protein
MHVSGASVINTVTGVRGDALTLSCTTGSSLPVAWTYQGDGNETGEPIFVNKQLVNGADGRYEVNTTAVGQYDLIIKNVQPGVVGRYQCIDNDEMGPVIVEIHVSVDGLFCLNLAVLFCYFVGFLRSAEAVFRYIRRQINRRITFTFAFTFVCTSLEKFLQCVIASMRCTFFIPIVVYVCCEYGIFARCEWQLQ